MTAVLFLLLAAAEVQQSVTILHLIIQTEALAEVDVTKA
jgi:hypothetical protein